MERSASGVSDLEDAVPDLLAQDELRIGGYPHEDVVEFQLAGGARADHVPAAQQIDEILEQRAVEELGGVEAVEHGNALGVQLAALLEHGLRDLPAAGGDELCNHQVVALDGLDGGLRKHGELHGLAR